MRAVRGSAYTHDTRAYMHNTHTSDHNKPPRINELYLFCKFLTMTSFGGKILTPECRFEFYTAKSPGVRLINKIDAETYFVIILIPVEYGYIVETTVVIDSVHLECNKTMMTDCKALLYISKGAELGILPEEGWRANVF